LLLLSQKTTLSFTGFLNTLGQSGTRTRINEPVLIVGKGSKPGSGDDLKKKAKKKIITQKLVLSMVDAAKQNGKEFDKKNYGIHGTAKTS